MKITAYITIISGLFFSFLFIHSWHKNYVCVCVYAHQSIHLYYDCRRRWMIFKMLKIKLRSTEISFFRILREITLLSK